MYWIFANFSYFSTISNQFFVKNFTNLTVKQLALFVRPQLPIRKYRVFASRKLSVSRQIQWLGYTLFD
jgi:hypothetical protein